MTTAVSAPHSLRAWVSSYSVYSGLMQAAIAPAFHTPNSAMTNWGMLGITSATRSPFLTPAEISALAKALLSSSKRLYEIDVPL